VDGKDQDLRSCHYVRKLIEREKGEHESLVNRSRNVLELKDANLERFITNNIELFFFAHSGSNVT
jgi:hypothetical protein